jgi:DNA (cytosine-5)-methyltransferase 1
MAAYYNEHDPFAAAWLRELITAGVIANGEVDERDIRSVTPDDVRGFVQCHFFAGIGGWSYALRLAGWDDNRPVWTGSCPCQGYSAAGKQQGAADARNLWPTWFRLIREREPVTVFGEQVANATGHGWLDAVSTDLERETYAVGSLVLGAHSVGAPHRRQRLWFVADANGGDALNRDVQRGGEYGLRAESRRAIWHARDDQWTKGDVGYTDQSGRQALDVQSIRTATQLIRLESSSAVGDVGHAYSQRHEKLSRDEQGSRSPWSDCVWIACRDGKRRPTESGLQPLAHGVPARLGRLRGYGNAIVPQVAAEVIRAYDLICHGHDVLP